MDGLWLTSYLVAILFLGGTLVAIFSRKDSLLLSETIGVAVVLGTGSLGYGLFLLALLGVRPSQWLFVVLSAAAAAGGAYLLWRGKVFLRVLRPALPGGGWSRNVAAAALFALLVVFLAVVSAHALAFRVFEWDAFAIWGLKAKVVAAEGLAPRPGYFSDVSLSYSHLDYPLMVPFLMSGVFSALGRVDDQLSKLFLPVLYLGLMCLVFAFSRRRLSVPMASAVTVMAMGAPVMLRWAGSGNADVPLAAFYAASAMFLLEWEKDLKWRSCILCGAMAGFAAFTKSEGLVAGALVCAAMFLLAIRSAQWRNRLAGAALCTAVFMAVILPWVAFSREIPRTHENYLAHLTLSEVTANAHRVLLIVGAFARQIVSVWSYGLLWIVLIASAIVGWRAFLDRSALMVWLLLLLQLGIYALSFLVTPWDVREQLSVALDRLVVHVIPLGGMLIALHMSSSRGGDSRATGSR